MTISRAGQWCVAVGCCFAAVVACIVYVDRPVADFVHAQVRPTTEFVLAGGVRQPLRLIRGLVILFLLGGGGWTLFGRPVSPWARLPLECARGGFWALSISVVLKVLVGRSEVELFLSSRVYELRPLHGGSGYEGFPSTTMAVAAAVLVIVWLRRRRLRVLCGLVLTWLACWVVVTTSHWVADTLAGGCLGAFIGWRLAPRGGSVPETSGAVLERRAGTVTAGLTSPVRASRRTASGTRTCRLRTSTIPAGSD
jgi:hypothetical protein